MSDKDEISYEVFAEFYDPVMGERTESIERVKQLIQEYRPDAKVILELAVGTGSVLKGLADNYEVAGLDLSPKMLEIAKQKVPQAQFYEGDMSNFELGRTFDVVICVFDSINHLRNFAQWEGLFASAARHANADGLFIFDMNTTGRLKRLAAQPSAEQELEAGRMLMKVHQVGDNAFAWDIKVYENQTDGMHKLHEEHIVEVGFPIVDVQKAAEKCFEPVTRFDISGGAASDELDRTFFVYRKSTN